MVLWTHPEIFEKFDWRKGTAHYVILKKEDIFWKNIATCINLQWKKQNSKWKWLTYGQGKVLWTFERIWLLLLVIVKETVT